MQTVPDDFLRTSYELYESFQQAKKNDGTSKITDLFLIKTGNGLEFLHKKSGRAVWLRFVNGVKQLFGKKDSTFSFEEPLLQAAKKLEEATKLEFSRLEPFAQDLGLDAKQVRLHFYELGLHLKSVKSHVEESRALQGKSIANLENIKITLYDPESVMFCAQRHLFDSASFYSKEAESLLQSICKKKLTSAEYAEIRSVVVITKERVKVLKALENKEVAPLRLALMQALSTAGTERAAAIRKALKATEPKSTLEPIDPTKLKDFAMVFGDSFIAESGLEGDYSTRPYSDLVRAFIQEKMADSPAAKNIDAILSNHIDLRKHELADQPLAPRIQEALKANSSCILFGGWIEHALVYEIKKQPDGKYSFRIFNEGAGIELHDQLQNKYKTAYEGCIAIQDIPEHLLYQDTTLNSLRAFIGMAKEGVDEIKPEMILINHLLPMLDGKEVKADPRIDRFLSPQRSGTCCYRSLLAWIASKLPEKEYKLFKFEFKLFLLDQYLPQLQAVAKKTIKTKEEYDTARRTLCVIKRSLEKFASGVEKLKAILPNREIENALQKMDQYRYYLSLFDQKIVDFEKQKLSTTVESLSSRRTEFTLFSPRLFKVSDKEALTFPSDEQPINRFTLLKMIRDLPTKQLSEKLETLLAHIAKIDREDQAAKLVAEALFKKIGSIHEWDGIRYNNPVEACSNLQAICARFGMDASKQSFYMRARDQGLFLYAAYAVEQAYKQLPDHLRVLQRDHANILTDIPSLTHLRTSDPFWTSIFQELRKVVEARPKENIPLSNVILGQQEWKNTIGAYYKLAMNPQLTRDIWSWYTSEDQRELKAKVDRSIQEERASEEGDVQNQVTAAKVTIQSIEQEIAAIEAMPEDQQDKRKLREKKGAIELYNQAILRASHDVIRHAKGWPKGFETAGSRGGLSDEKKGAFLLVANGEFREGKGNFFKEKLGVENPLPKPFHEFCGLAIIAANLHAQKLQLGSRSYECGHWEWNWYSNEVHIFPATYEYDQNYDALTDDPYLPKLHNEEIATLYKAIFAKRTEEGHIPHDVVEQDAKELYSIRSASEVQLESLFSYFYDNLDKLADSDSRSMLHSLLFESDLLLKELSSEKKRDTLIEMMQGFFTKTIQNAIDIEDYAQAASLFWIATNVERYINFTGKTAPSFVDHTLIFELVEKASQPKCISQLPAVFESILASSIDITNKIPETEIEKKLFAMALLSHIIYTQNPTAQDEKCLARIEAADTAKAQIQDRLRELKNADILKMLNSHVVPHLGSLYPQVAIASFSKGKATGEYIGKDKTVLRLASGRLILKDPEVMGIYPNNIPEKMIESLQMLRIYGEDEDLSHLRCRLSEFEDIESYASPKPITTGAFIFDSKKNVHMLLVPSSASHRSAKLYVRDTEGAWNLLEKERSLENQELINKFHTLKKDRTLTLIDPETFTPVYKVEDKHLVRIEDGLEVVQPPDGSPFSSFEDPSCTIYLADAGGDVQEIQFSRLGITLIQEDDRFKVMEQKGWHVAKEQFLPHFGQATGFLVLENEKGQKKALLPVWDPEVEAQDEEAKKRALNFPYAYNFQAEEMAFGNTVEYDIQDLKLLPKSSEARFYLAKIYLEKGMLDEAEELLFTPFAEITSRKLTLGEQDLLKKLALTQFSKDIGSRTLLIRMRALYLLESASAQFPEKKKEIDKDEHEVKVELMSTYLNRLGHIRPLDPRHEMLLLKRIGFPLRLHELEGQDELFSKEKVIRWEMGTPWGEMRQLGQRDKSRVYTPTPQEMMRYQACRKKNEFPFNPLNATDEELKTYYKLLETEAREAKSLDDQATHHFISVLYHLAFFGKTDTVQLDAKYLLKEISNAVLDRNKSIAQYTLPLKKEQLAPPSRGKAELFGLDLITLSKAEDSFFEQFLTPSSAALSPAREEHDTLFDPNTIEAKDATTKKFFKKVDKDIEIAEGKAKLAGYSLNEEIDQIIIRLNEEMTKESQALAKQEEIILASVHAALTQDPVSRLQFTSKKRMLPTIEELCIISARKDFEALARRLYPELARESLSDLQAATKQYLIRKQYVLHLSRGVTAAKDGQTKGLLDELQAKRAYSNDHPRAAVFALIESTLNITLRPDQVKNIETLDENMQEGRAVAIQMIMGAGKTSILQPLLAFLFATPESLSTVIVPESLFEPVREGLLKAFGSAFNNCVYHLPYTRELSHDQDYLKLYKEKLLEAKERGSVVLMTPRQKHSIITSLYEAYDDYNAHPDATSKRRVELISEITEFLQLEEVDQIDEADLVMNSKVIFKYPIGEKEVVDTDRASIVAELVVNLAQDKDISVDFAKRLQERMGGKEIKEAQGMTKDFYAATVLPKLVSIATSLLQKKDPLFQKLASSPYLEHFLAQSTPFDDEIANYYLPKEELKIKQKLPKTIEELEKITDHPRSLIAQKLIYQQKMVAWITKEVEDPKLREAVGVLAQAISNILPNSLTKVCGQNYGIDLIGKKFVAKPYGAARSPKPTQYSDPFEQVVYSTQLALYYGLPRQAAKQMVTELQTQIKQEMIQSGCLYVETKGYKRFCEIFKEEAKSFSFTESPPSDRLIDALQRVVSSRPELLLEYVKGYVFNQISRYSKSVSSTPQTLGGCSKVSVAYAGTMHEEILPLAMRRIPEVGTDGTTISAVQRKNPQVMHFKGALSQQVIDSFVKDKDLYVFTDSGGWLKEDDIEEYAETLLEKVSGKRKEIQGVVYHNDKGEIVCLERVEGGGYKVGPLSKSQYKPQDGQLLTIIQQKYETGTNILQKPLAKNLLSIRKGMTLRDALQSIFRMRKILQGQTVMFAISDDVKQDIAANLVDSLLAKPEFRSLFNKKMDVKPAQVIEGLHLDPKLSQYLIDAFKDIEKQRKTHAPSVLVSQLILAFTKRYEVDSESLWRYFGVNQAAFEQELNWLAGRQRMREVVEKFIRLALSKSAVSVEKRNELFITMQEFLLQKEPDSSFAQVIRANQHLDAKTAIELEVERHAAVFRKLQIHTDRPIEEILRSCIDEESISEVVQASDYVQGQELEQEREKEKEKEIEREVEIEQEEKTPDIKEFVPLVEMIDQESGYDLSKLIARRFDPITELIPAELRLPGSANLFYSPNFFIEKARLGTTLHASYSLPGEYIMAIEERNKPRRYILVSHEDAARIKKGVYSQNLAPGQAVSLFNLHGQKVAGSKSFNDELHRQILLQAKLYTGKARYSQTEVEFMQKMVPDKQTHDSLRELYENIIKYKPVSFKRYQGSHLEQMLSVMSES